MKCTFACKKVSLNDSIKEYTEKKVSKLDRYFQQEPAAFVTIRGGNTIFRAQTQETDGDMRSAVDAAISYIERQILKNKTRLSKRMRSEAFPAPAEMDDFSVAEEKEFDIVRTKRFTVKPMSAEEAILQLNLLDHDFFAATASSSPGKRSKKPGERREPLPFLLGYGGRERQRLSLLFRYPLVLGWVYCPCLRVFPPY